MNEQSPKEDTLVTILLDKYKVLNSPQKVSFLKDLTKISSEENMLFPDKENKNTKKRKTMDPEIKQKAIKIWKKNRNYSLTASILNKEQEMQIDESYVRRWIKEDLSSEEIKQTLKKVKITSRKAKFNELEEDFVKWFKSTREKKVPITLQMIQDQALSLFRKLKENNPSFYIQKTFCASSGWFRNFKRRHGISKRMGTHVASKLSDDYASQISLFFGNVRKLK